MDRNLVKELKEAQAKADEAIKQRELAKNPANKEFWQEKVKILKETKLNLENQLAEINYAIECYERKI